MKDWLPIPAQAKTPEDCIRKYRLEMRFGERANARVYARIYRRMTGKDIPEETRPDGNTNDGAA